MEWRRHGQFVDEASEEDVKDKGNVFAYIEKQGVLRMLRNWE